MTKIYSYTTGTGPDLVLLHGWASNGDIWQEFLPFITDDFCVTVVDLPGFGRSDMLPEYNLQTLTEALLTIVPATAYWMGWSLGGLLATSAALSAPERVLGVVNVASSPCFIAHADWLGILPEKFQLFKKNLVTQPFATIRDFYARLLRSEKEALRFLEKLQQMLFAYGEPNQEALQKSLNILEENLIFQLQQMTVPLAYILGESDSLVPVKIVDLLKDASPQVFTHVIPNASHIPFFFQPEEFAKLLKNILYV